MTSCGDGCCWTFFLSVFFSIFNFENYLLVSCVPYFYSSWDASRHVTKLVVRVVSASSSVWSAPNHGFVLFSGMRSRRSAQPASIKCGRLKKKTRTNFFCSKNVTGNTHLVEKRVCLPVIAQRSCLHSLNVWHTSDLRIPSKPRECRPRDM